MTVLPNIGELEGARRAVKRIIAAIMILGLGFVAGCVVGAATLALSFNSLDQVFSVPSALAKGSLPSLPPDAKVDWALRNNPMRDVYYIRARFASDYEMQSYHNAFLKNDAWIDSTASGGNNEDGIAWYTPQAAGATHYIYTPSDNPYYSLISFDKGNRTIFIYISRS